MVQSTPVPAQAMHLRKPAAIDAVVFVVVRNVI